jgi:hypothetical protein
VVGEHKKNPGNTRVFFIGLSAYCRLALANFSVISVSAVPRITLAFLSLSACACLLMASARACLKSQNPLTLPAGRQAQRIILEVKPPLGNWGVNLCYLRTHKF